VVFLHYTGDKTENTPVNFQYYGVFFSVVGPVIVAICYDLIRVYKIPKE
jgi:hypothetical protein